MPRRGSRLPILSSAATTEGGSVLAISIDLTERKRAEQAAGAEQARFQALVENGTDGIVLCTEMGTMVYVSPAAAGMLGRTVAEVIGTRLHAYVQPEDTVDAAYDWLRVLARESLPPRGRRVVRPDGTVRWIEVTATNLLGTPAVGAIVGNVRDITDRKLVDDALMIAQQRFTALVDSGTIGIIVSDASGRIHEVK